MYCKKCSLYSWTVTYDTKRLYELCKKQCGDTGPLCNVTIVQKDKAGLVMSVGLHGRTKSVTISGKQLYSLLPEVKSFYFDSVKKPGKYIFSGRGFGHHIGLCQWGAREMVRQGWNHKAILRFYYPGTHFIKLTK
jgi:stage II sporulation protein D